MERGGGGGGGLRSVSTQQSPSRGTWTAVRHTWGRREGGSGSLPAVEPNSKEESCDLLCAQRESSTILPCLELVDEDGDSQEVHHLRHDEQVVMVLDHEPEEEQQLREGAKGALSGMCHVMCVPAMGAFCRNCTQTAQVSGTAQTGRITGVLVRGERAGRTAARGLGS